ncbi:MAG: sugar transferase [Nitrospinota bacterium]|nr:MAG: sugar transferase [Nitrospinota bacterium]
MRHFLMAKRGRGRNLWSRSLSSLGKRIFDLCFASVVLFLTLPLFPVIALLIRWDSPGPIFFRQQRVGKDGKLFTMYKFRTMYVQADPYAPTPVDDRQDARVTRVGYFLRKSGLDELPQFFNVIKGEMSVVGPRPEMPFLVEKYTERQRKRLQVLPGITGLWQISSARNRPIHENLQYDYYYIRHQSLWLDLIIVGKTFLLTFRSCLTALPRVKKVGWKRGVKYQEYIEKP